MAAWLAFGTLPTELVPGWAAHWLADGLHGEPLATLAGLHGDDPRDVRDVLPDALAEAGAPVPALDWASVEVAYDFIARRCLDGSASEHWVAQKVEELFVNSTTGTISWKRRSVRFTGSTMSGREAGAGRQKTWLRLFGRHA